VDRDSVGRIQSIEDPTKAKRPLFPARSDSLYLLRIGSAPQHTESESQPQQRWYAGQATTHARALSHWAGSHSKTVAAAIEEHVRDQPPFWPNLLIHKLSVGGLDDLTNAETLLIDILKWDHRVQTLNKNGGSRYFHPRRSDGDKVIDEFSVALHWQHLREGGWQFLGASLREAPPADEVPGGQSWYSAGFRDPENARGFVSAANAVARMIGLPLTEIVGGAWQGFFDHLVGQNVGHTGGQLPYRPPRTLRELAGPQGLNGPYLWANVTGESFESDDRAGIAVGLTNKQLLARACEWWGPGSRSLSGEHTVGRLLHSGYRSESWPRFLVAGYSRGPGFRVVLGVWPLSVESSPLKSPHERKLSFKDLCLDPNPQTARVVGTHIIDEVTFGGCGLFWVDVSTGSAKS